MKKRAMRIRVTAGLMSLQMAVMPVWAAGPLPSLTNTINKGISSGVLGGTTTAVGAPLNTTGPVQTSIHTDTTLAGAAALACAGAGFNCNITQANGVAAGSNLFFSFSDFNIDTTGKANFNLTGSFSNVISRVTGETAGGSFALNPSFIWGTINVNATGTPAFFLINPAGLVFGHGANINVPGAFHASTADYLQFANGDIFWANGNPGAASMSSTLSSSNPSAFGFLSNSALTSAQIAAGDTTGASGVVAVLAGTSMITGTQSSAPGAQGISFVGGDVQLGSIEYDTVNARYYQTNIAAPGSDIHAVAFGNAGNALCAAAGACTAAISIPFTGTPITYIDPVTGNPIPLPPNSPMGIPTVSPIKVPLSATLASGGSADGTMLLSGTVAFPGTLGGILSTTLDTTENLSNFYGTVAGNLRAGNVYLAGGNVTLDGANITIAYTSGSIGGNLYVDASRNFALLNSSSLLSEVQGATAAGGVIDINAKGSFTVASNSFIDADGWEGAQGGDIVVYASSVLLDGSQHFKNGFMNCSSPALDFVDTS